MEVTLNSRRLGRILRPLCVVLLIQYGSHPVMPVEASGHSCLLMPAVLDDLLLLPSKHTEYLLLADSNPYASFIIGSTHWVSVYLLLYVDVVRPGIIHFRDKFTGQNFVITSSHRFSVYYLRHFHPRCVPFYIAHSLLVLMRWIQTGFM